MMPRRKPRSRPGPSRALLLIAAVLIGWWIAVAAERIIFALYWASQIERGL